MELITLQHPSLIICYGRPGSGKSILIKYIIQHYQQLKLVDFVFVMSGSNFNGFYQGFLPERQVKSYSDNTLTRLLALLERKKSNNENFRTLLVLDDCLGSTAFKSPIMMKCINNFRHYSLSLVLASQYPFAIPPNLRENAFRAFVFAQTTKRALTALYESYAASDFEHVNEFVDFMKKHTGDYHCLVIDNKQNDFDKKWARFKAPI